MLVTATKPFVLYASVSILVSVVSVLHDGLVCVLGTPLSE